MSGASVKVEGLEACMKTLEQLGPEIANKLIKRTMRKATVPLLQMAKANALAILRDAEARGYKRKEGSHLYQTLGVRLRAYQRGANVFIASGPLWQQGGFHGHLVESGHRIVTGGTIARPSRIAGLTASGRRYLQLAGLNSRQMKKVGYRFNDHQVRGGGRVLEHVVRGKPYMKPAWETTKHRCYAIIVTELRSNVEKEARRIAKKNGVNG